MRTKQKGAREKYCINSATHNTSRSTYYSVASFYSNFHWVTGNI